MEKIKELNRYQKGILILLVAMAIIFGVLYARATSKTGFLWTRSNPNAWQDFLLYLQQPQFMSIVVIMFLLIAIPLYLLTYWFYGKQAQRMATRMFG